MTKTQQQRKYYKKLMQKVDKLRYFKEVCNNSDSILDPKHQQDLERAEGNLEVFLEHHPEYLI